MKILKIFSFVLSTGAIIFGFYRIATAEVLIADARPANIETGKVLGITSTGNYKSLLPVESYSGLSDENAYSITLKRLGIETYPEDIITVFPDPKYGIGYFVQIARATHFIIIDGGKKTEYRTFKDKVGDALQEKNIELGDKDKIEPSQETILKVDLEIKITRVSITELKTKEAIEYQTVNKDDANLDKGVTKISQKGFKGERVKTFEVRCEDGVEVARKLIKNEVTKEPVSEIIVHGTKEVVLGQGKATWFGAPAMTAAHNSLPKGTMVEVKNLANGKTVVVKIIGGGILGSAIIDLSPDAFEQLAPLGSGVIQVRLSKP